MSTALKRKVLIPFDQSEAISLTEAGVIAGRGRETIRLWAIDHGIGRLVAGRWAVSRVALAMYLDDDREALDEYLSGDRQSPRVRPYFERVGLIQQEAAA
jgi:hypothetical protein